MVGLHLQVLGPTGDSHCSNCYCCPCAHLDPWSGAGNKGTAARNRPALLPHSLSAPGMVKVVLVGGGSGLQKHTSDQRDACTFPSWWQNCLYQQKGKTGFTPCVSKYCNSNSHITSRSTCTVCSYERRTVIDFADRLKCHCMRAQLTY